MDTGDVRRAARRAGDSQAVEAVARVGFVVNGILHLLIGIIAIQIAWGLSTTGGGSADQSGALGALAQNGLGRVILWIAVLGFLGLAVWQLAQAIGGQGLQGKASERLKAAGKGIVYLAVASTAFTFARGGSSSSKSQSTDFTANLLGKPLGTALVVIVGLAIVGVGVYHIIKGWQKKFLQDLQEHPGQAVVTLARFGYIAKGVALMVVGGLFVLAAVNHDPKKASGLDGALRAMGDGPFGKLLLTLVALGFLAYGIYSFVRAKKARV